MLEDDIADQTDADVEIRLEIQNENYFSDAIDEEIQELSELEHMQPNPEDELPSESPEDFDENGFLTYDEWLEQAEEKELMKDVAEEK